VKPAEHGQDERRLALGAVQVLAALVPPVAGVAYLAAGWPGVVSALIGLGFVLVLFGGSAALLAMVAARRSDGGVGLLVVGASIRLPLYLGVLTLLGHLPWVHGRSLAAATAFAIAVTLAYELRLMSRMPRLFWVDAQPGPQPVFANDTRSRSL
jgi:hypothetical protein